MQQLSKTQSIKFIGNATNLKRVIHHPNNNLKFKKKVQEQKKPSVQGGVCEMLCIASSKVLISKCHLMPKAFLGRAQGTRTTHLLFYAIYYSFHG